MNIYICLEDIRSLYNIGAIFRTCSFYGLYNILLLGYSGKTHDAQGNSILHPEILKTSLGAEQDLNIKLVENQKDLLEIAKENNLEIVTIEQTSNSIDIHKAQESKKNYNWNNKIIVFGNEVTGVSEDIIKISDYVFEIKRKGKHNSLNVTTTCGIVLDIISSSN